MNCVELVSSIDVSENNRF